MKCEICGKEVKNIKAHIRMAHPGSGEVKELEVQVNSLTAQLEEAMRNIAELTKQAENTGKVGKSIEDIAKILYTDIVKPLGEEYGFTVQEWGSFDPAGYIQVARKIKG